MIQDVFFLSPTLSDSLEINFDLPHSYKI
ncbi:hypothetical protein AYI70_g4225, partial [Smittium culicis]